MSEWQSPYPHLLYIWGQSMVGAALISDSVHLILLTPFALVGCCVPRKVAIGGRFMFLPVLEEMLVAQRKIFCLDEYW